MTYRERNRKTIDLPSGSRVTIRKLNGYDYLAAGSLPIHDLAHAGKSPNGQPKPEAIEEGLRLVKLALVEATSRFTDPEGAVYQIVDKSWRDTGPAEIAIEDLDQADAQAIVDSIMDFSGLNREAAQAGPFPQAQTAPASPCPGQGLPGAPQPAPETLPG